MVPEHSHLPLTPMDMGGGDHHSPPSLSFSIRYPVFGMCHTMLEGTQDSCGLQKVVNMKEPDFISS